MLSLTTSVTPEEDPGVTEEKEIDDLLMQMEKCKSPICFSSVLPELLLGVTIGQWLKDRELEEILGPGDYKWKSRIVEGS